MRSDSAHRRRLARAGAFALLLGALAGCDRGTGPAPSAGTAAPQGGAAASQGGGGVPPANGRADGGGAQAGSGAQGAGDVRPAAEGQGATGSKGAAGGTGGGAAGGGNAAGAPSAPVSVTTVRAERRSLPVLVDATGTVVPVTSVDVKPQVASVVKSVQVKEGQFVKAGDLLFTLDARADEANLEKLRAQMARDETTLADLRRVLDRNKELRERNFVSQAVVESSQAQVDAQAAAVAADRAAIQAARVPLSYARIVAPSSGRVGVIGAWPGAAVIANQTTLVTVTQIDPIDVSFPVPQRWLQDVLAALGGGAATVNATLPDGSRTLTGKLVFVDSAIDASSGTVKVKARFANSPAVLWPGAFVRTSLALGSIDDAVVVPQASIVRGPRGTFVFVVVDGRAVARPVEVVGSRGDDAAVRGLKAGDAVVLDGRQNLRPGWPVIEQGAGPVRGAGLVQPDPSERRSVQ